MDVNSLTNVISSVGFPIFCCGCLGYFIMKQSESYSKQISELRNEHKIEVQKLTEALNNNTLILQKILDRIDK